jgi:exodeoxyribonuclease VII large subunit
MLEERPTSPDQLAFTLEPTRRIYTVSELNEQLQRLIDQHFRSIWVDGEVSGVRQPSSGHYYFTLKDGQSQLKCVLFRGNARVLKFRPQDGLAVLARGSLSVYEERGEYQLNVELLEPRGAGALQLAFEQLKKKLEAEGLFRSDRKRKLPLLPRRIGLVTSPTGAVIRDMLHVLERRFPGLHIRLYPALVQGEGSAEQVTRAIRYFSSSGWAEVVIVARGGGSLSDLWTFNEELVARAIASSKVPVISAIGHETDFTIADFVADLRAPTPSAAAELVVPPRANLVSQVDSLHRRAAQLIRLRLAACFAEWRLQGLERAETMIHRQLGRRMQRLDDLEFRLREWQRASLGACRAQLDALAARLRAADLRLRFGRARDALSRNDNRLRELIRQHLVAARRRYEPADAHLSQLSPMRVLERGYAIVTTSSGGVLRSAASVAPGDSVKIRLSSGSAGAIINEVSESPSL